MNCSYCAHQATQRIPSLPERVCQAHASEFWTGLMAYSKNRSIWESGMPSGYWACHELGGANTPSLDREDGERSAIAEGRDRAA